MGFSLSKVQDYRKVPGKNEVRLVGENPYLRFVNSDHSAIYLQGGQFYAEGGQVIEPEPWVIESVCRVKVDKLRKVGLDTEKFESTYDTKIEPVKKIKVEKIDEEENPESDVSQSETPAKRRR